MSTTADRSTAPVDGGAPEPLAPADGLVLLGKLDGSGYRQDTSLARRADGQVVQLGPLMYALLEELDGVRGHGELAAAMCDKLGRPCEEEHVVAIAQKLALQGLLAGSEHNAPQRSNPLLALRWKVVVTDPDVTGRLAAPFTWLFRPVILFAVIAAFLAACWLVLVEQGLAPGAAQAFARPELILLLFGLGIASAAFHELGHAAACRYGGGTPGAMGMGLYLVWPAFYTDVTDAYRLPARARLRTDLGGLYFNSIVAVATVAAWLYTGLDSLLLLVAMQLFEMVKQLSPVIRADGYHILADLTGVPDLYAHIAPTLGRLLPGQRDQPSALTGRARILVTLWVLVIVPVLLAVMLSVVLILPRLLASTWQSGTNVLDAMAAQAGGGDLAELLVSLLRLVGLALPVLGAGYIAWRLLGGAARRAAAWSRGRPRRRAATVAMAAALAALLGWAWWPAGQYQPISAEDRGTIVDAGRLIASPASARQVQPGAARASGAPADGEPEATPVEVPDGTHLSVALIPEGGATEEAPAIFLITDEGGGMPVVLSSETASSESADDVATATAFPFVLPEAPREGDLQALAVNRTDGGVTYTIAYAVVTVENGDPVDQRNGAHAYANCVACTTVAVSFQVVLVVGTSPLVAPINVAEAFNGSCPDCVTTAIATQVVVTVGSEPSEELLAQLQAELARLEQLEALGADVTAADLAAQVAGVQESINRILSAGGSIDDGDAAAVEEEEGAADETGDAEGEADAADEEEASEGTATDPSTAPSDPTTTEPAPDATTESPTTGTGTTTTS